MPHTLEKINTDQVFAESAAPLLVVDDSLVIRAVNPRYLAVTGRTREALLGALMFEAFPDNPEDPSADGVRNLTASFEAAFRTGRHHRMALQRYDIRGQGPEDGFVRRFWTPVNSPLHDTDGRVVGALHHVEDVTGVLEPILEGVRGVPHSLDESAWNRLVGALVAETFAHGQTQVRANQLSQALTSRIVIEQAKGVLMASRRIDPDEAFETLRHWSRSTNQRLHDVCAEVIATLELPPPIVRKRPGHARP